MTVSDDDLLRIQGWPLGINNLAKETALPQGALRDAVNVDLDRDGKPTRRPGRTLAVAGTLVHSAWGHDYLPFGLFVDGADLKAFHSDHTTDTLLSGLAIGLPVSYDLIGDAVYWSNGQQSGLVTADMDVVPWCCPFPSGQPTVAVATGGSLDLGEYQIAVTWVDARGRESGAAVAAAVHAPTGSALQLTNIPQPTDPIAVPIVRVYATGGNDGVLRLARALPAGQTATAIHNRPVGQTLKTMHLRPLPPGQIIRKHAGRQFVARGRELLFSPAMRYGVFNPAEHRVGFTQRIDMLEPVGDGGDGSGLFIADAKKTYFLAGANPNDWLPRVAYSFGAVPGTSAITPGNIWGGELGAAPIAVWLAKNGLLCLGLPGGTVQALKINEAVIDQAERGAMLYRESGGLRQIIAALRGVQPQVAGVRDAVIVHEYRHTA